MFSIGIQLCGEGEWYCNEEGKNRCCVSGSYPLLPFTAYRCPLTDTLFTIKLHCYLFTRQSQICTVYRTCLSAVQSINQIIFKKIANSITAYLNNIRTENNLKIRSFIFLSGKRYCLNILIIVIRLYFCLRVLR